MLAKQHVLDLSSIHHQQDHRAVFADQRGSSREGSGARGHGGGFGPRQNIARTDFDAVAHEALYHAEAHRTDPKILWSGLVWLIYLSLILMRWKFAQGGRRFALGAIGSFVFVLLTFWGVNLLSPLHNP